MIIRTKEIYITPTPEELAKEFCEMDCDQQAVFFNQIAKNVANWDNPFCFQLHNIMTSDVLTLDGRWVMEQIGIYSKPLSDEEITKNLKVKTDETCHICKWTNVSLINLGEPNKPRWTCQGCCKRMLEENKNV